MKRAIFLCFIGLLLVFCVAVCAEEAGEFEASATEEPEYGCVLVDDDVCTIAFTGKALTLSDDGRDPLDFKKLVAYTEFHNKSNYDICFKLSYEQYIDDYLVGAVLSNISYELVTLKSGRKCIEPLRFEIGSAPFDSFKETEKLEFTIIAENANTKSQIEYKFCINLNEINFYFP